MAYKMKGYNYPGKSPLNQLSEASTKANGKSPFRKGAGEEGESKAPMMQFGEFSGGRNNPVDYQEDSGGGTHGNEMHTGDGETQGELGSGANKPGFKKGQSE